MTASRYILISNVWEFQFFHILTNTCYFSFFLFLENKAILVAVKWYLIVVLICIPLKTDDFEHLSNVLIGHLYISSLEKRQFISFMNFGIGLFCFCFWVLGILCIFWILVPYQIYDLQIFFSFFRLSFCFLYSFFDAWKFLILMKSVYLFFFLLLPVLLVSHLWNFCHSNVMRIFPNVFF